MGTEVNVTDIVPWLAFFGASASVATVIKYYQDRAKSREDRARVEQELVDQIHVVKRDVEAVREEIKEVNDATLLALAKAELARGELHTAQLAMADKYVSNRELNACEARMTASVDRLGIDIKGMSDRLDRMFSQR